MAKTRSRTRLWAAVPLAVLVFAGWQTTTTFVRTPALNPSLLVETADGDRFPRFLPAMYSYPDYLFQVASDWRNQPPPDIFRNAFAELPSTGGMFTRLRGLRDLLEKEMVAQSLEPASERNARRSAVAVTDSLRLQPGNPSAWVLLARANLALGERKTALEAFLASQELAPKTSVFAAMRLGVLKAFLKDPEGQRLARSMIAPQAIITDQQAARLLGYKTLADSPEISDFLEELPISN